MYLIKNSFIEVKSNDKYYTVMYIKTTISLHLENEFLVL